MIVPFRQGIIRYPYSGSIQNFLQISGSYVNLTADNGPTEITLAHRTTNYLHIENSTVPNAWGPFTGATDQWLYWDIDLLTGARTFGITLVEPEFSATEPTSPVTDLHWYDTTNEIMFVYQGGSFTEVVRVFAAKFDGVVTFSTVAAGLTNLPFAGSQVGLINSQNSSGRIVFDDNGDVIKRESSELFTTEDQFFAAGSQINAVRLESSVHHATANQNVAAFNIVKYLSTGKIGLAVYEDIGNAALAVVLEDALTGETTTTMIQGVISNPLWNWQTVGAELWVTGDAGNETGLLTEIDPNTSDPSTYPVKQVPIARVLSNKEIIFEQGLGGIGKTGLSGAAGSLVNASSSVKGTVFLTADPALATNPLAVGDNDARMTDARVPLAHTQAATTITFSPSGNLSSGDVQLAIQEVDTEKVAIAGDTLTGYLTLNAAPTNTLHAATKQYVDNLVSGLAWQAPIQYVNLIDDSLSAPPGSLNSSDAYIVAGTGTGGWAGLDGKIVIWDGASWIDNGLLSSQTAGNRFGIAFETTTTPGGSFVGKKNQIAVLDNPATPTWSYVTPSANDAVFVNNESSLHAFHQYVYNATLTKWVEIAGGGAITADAVVFTPAGNIAAINVQTALEELDTEKALSTHTHVQTDITDLSIPYDLALQVTGLPDASAIVFRYVAVRAFTIDATTGQAKAAVASTGTAVFDIQVNAVSQMSATFTASATGVVTTLGSPAVDLSIVAGDVITIVAPGSQDATLADIGVSLLGNIP